MSMTFPSSPTTGQQYSVSGGPTYTWDGTVWKILTPGSQFSEQQFTATAGQTSFTVSGGYVIGAVDVYRNGVKLVIGLDFTATDLSTVVLTNAASAGDTIEVVKAAQILYADALKKTGDTMTGNLNVSGIRTTNGPTPVPFGASCLMAGTEDTINSRIYVCGPDSSTSGQLTIYRATSTGTPLVNIGMDQAGRIFIPYQTTFQVYATANTAANNVIIYDAVPLNIGGGYNASTGRFTAPVTGTYQFIWSALANNTNTVYRYKLRKNGSSTWGTVGEPYALRHSVGNSDYNTNASATATVSLSAGDYVDVYFTPDNNLSSSISDAAGWSKFSGRLLG